MTLAGAVIGGRDHDRYLFPLSIPLTVAMFASATAPVLGWRTWAALTAFHLVAVRPLRPLGTDSAAGLGYLAAGMDLGALVLATAVSCSAIAAALAIAALDAAHPSRAAAVRATAPGEHRQRD